MTWHLTLLNWLIHTGLADFGLLLVGALAVAWRRQPIQRIRIIELTFAAALLVPCVGRLPGIPRWSAGWLTLEPVAAASPDTSQPTASAAESNHAWSIPTADVGSVLAVAAPAAGVSRSESTLTDAADAPSMPPANMSIAAWIVLVTYGCVAAGLLGRAAVGLGYLVWLCRKATPVSPEVAELFQEIAADAGQCVRLLASDRIDTPMAFGVGRPTILLPEELCRSGDTAALRYSLAHEWSHIECGDTWRWSLVTLAQCLFFYQPVFWWLRRQLRLCQDYLADARAAEQAAEREDYSAFLVAVARRRLRVPEMALGISDRRSNLYWRIIMLLDKQEPLQRRCLKRWTLIVTLIAIALLAASSAVRLDAGDEKGKKGDAPKQPAIDKPTAKGETLHYSGKVTNKDTGAAIAAAIVTVRRSLLGDPEAKEENKILEESKHTTDADGKYSFTIPPEQSSQRYLYIELDVEHPDYAPRKGFGYALGMIRKNEKMGGRPFFEQVELRPGKPITGQIMSPDGKPVQGVKILAYSNTDKPGQRFEYGSFAETRSDADGKFRLSLITPGPAVFWILPGEFVPSTHGLKDNKRGDLGTFTLTSGVRLRGKVLDARGKPMAGVNVNAETRERSEELQNLMVADAINRSAITNAKGEFEMRPLPPGTYRVKPDEHARDSAQDRNERKTIPVAGVFVTQITNIKEGMEPIEVCAVPHVTIEAQYLDSKGKPTRGHSPFVFGRMDREGWHAQGKVDANGKMVLQVPHGLDGVRIGLSTNEHGVLRWRRSKDGALNNGHNIDLGLVNDDVKNIEIIRYTAPILIINAVDKEGRTIKDFKPSVVYEQGKSPKERGSSFINGVRGDVYLEKQEDGRWRTSQMLPDEDITVTASADGHESKSLKLKIPEGEIKDVKLVLDPAAKQK